MNELVHGIRYAWSARSLTGGRGMGPVSTSLAAGELETWDRRLRDHVWAVGPDAAYTCVVHDDLGALIRTVPAVGADGRPESAACVLLGPALTPYRALGLTAWPGWDALPEGAAVPWTDLEREAHHGMAVLRERARSLPAARLAGLFGALLHAPREDYTVLGEPDPLAVVCALGDLLGAVPTFASDEPDDHRHDLPNAVFLRRAPAATTVAVRRRLVVDPADSDDAVSVFAASAAEAYVSGGVEALASIRRDEPPADLDEAREWAAAAQLAPGVLADVGSLPGLAPHVLGALERPATLDRLRFAARAATPGRLAAGLALRAPWAAADVLVEEALARTVRAAPGDRTAATLFDALVDAAPLSPELVAAQELDLARAWRIVPALLPREEAERLLDRVAANTPFAELVCWVDEHAAEEPHGASRGHAVLCAGAARATDEEVRVLAGRDSLVHAARRFAGPETEVAAAVARLLAALPPHSLHDTVVAQLAVRRDPALLHALDATVVDPHARATVHREIRHAFWEVHGLPDPDPGFAPQAAPAPERRFSWLTRPSRRPAEHRKPT